SGERNLLAVAFQSELGFSPAFGAAILVARQRRDLRGRVGWTFCQQAMQQERIEEGNGPGIDPERLERVEVHATNFDVLHPALSERVQGTFTRANHALGPDGSVKLVLDLQEAGGELVVFAARIQDTERLVGSVRRGQRVMD